MDTFTLHLPKPDLAEAMATDGGFTADLLLALIDVERRLGPDRRATPRGTDRRAPTCTPVVPTR